VDDAIAITILSTSFPPTLRVASAGAGEAPLAQLIVSAADSGAPVWWIVAQAWADAVAFHPMWVDVTPDDSEDEPPKFQDYGLDPIEDLPPSDPRHQAALRGSIDPLEDLPATDPLHQEALRRLRIDELALRQPLGVVTYGVVPEGFRQVHPAEGAVPVLTALSSYVVSADGLVNEGKIGFTLA
jgi:hypothetical protein